MENFKKLVDTLNMEEAIRMKKELEADDSWQELPENELIAKVIQSVLRDYKVGAESASPDVVRKYQNRCNELCVKWLELGLIKKK